MRPGQHPQGLTLAEVIVLIAVTALLATTLVGTITLCLRYYRESNFRTVLETNARQVMDSVTTEFRQAEAYPVTPPGNTPLLYPTPLQVITANPTTYNCVVYTGAMPPTNLIDQNTGLPNIVDPTNPLNYQVVAYYNLTNATTGCAYAVERAVWYQNGAASATTPTYARPPDVQSADARPSGNWTLLSVSTVASAFDDSPGLSASQQQGQVQLIVIPTYTNCVALTVVTNEEPISQPGTSASGWTWRYTDELDCKQVTALY